MIMKENRLSNYLAYKFKFVHIEILEKIIYYRINQNDKPGACLSGQAPGFIIDS